MKGLKHFRNPYLSLFANLLYAAGNLLVGFLSESLWFTAMAVYYAILSAMRFITLNTAQKVEKNQKREVSARRKAGVLLVVLSFCLIGINVLCAIKERGLVFHEIVMIGIATYTFTKMTLAIMGMVAAKKATSQIPKILQNISFADALGSLYSLQRSMLVSFPGMAPRDAFLFNIITGTVVWLTVLILGINLIGGKHTDMAKSKIIQTNEKIAKGVTTGYKKIEKGVVDGYKKIERGVVDGYTKIEDKFVDQFLTRDGETVEEAKKRLKNKDPDA